MENYCIVPAAIGAAAVIVGSLFSMCQLYRLVKLDAECRGMKHPGLWGAFALTGNNSTGLLLYLIGRRKHPIVSISEEQENLMARRKKRFGVGLVFLAAGAIMCVLSLFLSGQF